MAEYIEREALVQRLDASPLFSNIRDGGFFIKDGVLDIVQKQPAADVVEVVRCKDCKHHHWEQEPCHGKTEHFCSVLNAQVFADFYCYHGAKMDGKGEGE